MGFGSGGVIVGSTAAALQASIGNVAAGSLFATVTSVGMAGVGLSTVVATGGVGAVVGGVVYAAKKWYE
ncbi:hypothetical protein DM01DRAFT_305700 [Hesseltinella vesiculosa]|uniref:Uncharacterized protein n=1 Tax=Hesseltinella vesiculosa TaxID=101127 RepID=A0A1X2G6L2_9FUNG|nr:hypothetical protein DM01DRAFT_305700 [Hesseltinella vesiculosa]